MDEVDQAQRITDFWLAGAIAEQIGRTIASGASRMECIDCGAEIPEARRRAVPGCERCVACQGRLEQSA